MLTHKEKESLSTEYSINTYDNKAKFNPASVPSCIIHNPYSDLNSLEDIVIYIRIDSDKDDDAQVNLSLIKLLNFGPI